MASLQARLSDLITAFGTDIKQLRTWITGSSSGDLTGLTTTAKSSVVAAINEVNSTSGGAIPASYLDTDVSLTANSDTKIATQKATKAYADARIAAADAMVFKGTIDASTNPNYPAADAGWTYKISVAGKIGGTSGPNVEAGDTIYCLVDGTASGTQAAVGANWDIVQTNIDGAVVGPGSATASDLAIYSGSTGKIIQDSGVQVSTDTALATNNNTKVPTEGAIRAYLAANYYTQTQLGNPDTDLVALYTTAKA